MIKNSKPEYLMSTKNEKTAISRSIVATIRKNNGYFLERSKNMQYYYDIGDAKATEKTSQALREGQSKLRKKMIDHGIIADDLQSSPTEHMISHSPTNRTSQIDPNPVFVGDDSCSSVEKQDTDVIQQQQSKLEASLHRMFNDIQPKPILEQSSQGIGNYHFQPTNRPRNTNECRYDKPQSRIVTPPTTPPNQPNQQIDRKMRRRMSNEMFCPFSDDEIGTDIIENTNASNNNIMGDENFDDSNSIMTFDMDDEEMIDEEEDDLLASSLHSYQSIFPTTTPLPSLTNHFRALSELKDNIPMFDNDGDRTMFQHANSSQPSPISKHLRALSELKDQVPAYPPFSGQRNNAGFNNHSQNQHFNGQFNGNFPRNHQPMDGSSMEFESSLVFPSQVNFVN